ncbi:hypothetical protein KP509_23G056100 [Ceratopteris richardii]|uniref:Uncharacterized protein n=1 Tax=Ceratopteris richardii TaxID=49495 RepID=A0A8T2S030_CERRI|nr:hypothetical protein KP509_23G056100 [Ceratopteris richardii]
MASYSASLRLFRFRLFSVHRSNIMPKTYAEKLRCKPPLDDRFHTLDELVGPFVFDVTNSDSFVIPFMQPEQKRYRLPHDKVHDSG